MKFAEEERSGHKKHAWCSSFHRGGIHSPELVIVFMRQSLAPTPPPITPPASVDSSTAKTLILSRPDIILNGTCGKDYDGDNFTENGKFSSALYLEGASLRSPDSATRSYIKFNLSKVPKGVSIISATLNLRASSYGGRKGPFPQIIRAGLTEKDIETVSPRSWATFKPIGLLGTAYNDTELKRILEPSEIDAIDVTNAIKAVVEGNQPNNGIMLRFADENLVDLHYRNAFVSSNHQGGRQTPELIILYIPDGQ
jgi:hypothetical protein